MAVVALLGVLRQQLSMDLGWLSRFDGDRVIFQATHGDAESFGLGTHTTIRIDEHRADRLDLKVLTGELPPIIPDTRADVRTARMLAVTRAGIGAFAAMPIHDDDGLYGMVGCLGHAARPELGDRHRETLSLVARLLSVSVRDLDGMWQRGSQVWHAIRRILDAGGPRVVYQPIVDLHSGDTVGAETLARFPAPADPEWWFTHAYTVGLGVELELSVVRKALKVLPTLPAGARLGVNASPSALTGGLLDVLTNAGVDLTRLVVELTEQERSLDDPAVLSAADDLRSRGILIAADDVGSGYAGLKRLTHLRPEVIKLDQGLVQGIDVDPVRRAVATAVVDIAEAIGSLVVAEGIETAAGLAAVRDTGIRYGQGFLLARPQVTVPTLVAAPTRVRP